MEFLAVKTSITQHQKLPIGSVRYLSDGIEQDPVTMPVINYIRYHVYQGQFAYPITWRGFPVPRTIILNSEHLDLLLVLTFNGEERIT